MTTTQQDQNTAIAMAMFDYFNQHDWEKMAGLYSDPAAFRDPSLGTDIVPQSRQQTIEKYKAMGEMFPDLHDEVLQIYPSGDRHVIVEFLASGTAENGEHWTLPICTIMTIENGLISKDFTYYDRSQG